MFNVQQISSMEKIQKNKCMEYRQVDKKVVLAGESFAYQICVKAASPYERAVTVSAAVNSPFGENVKIYEVKDAYLDKPYTDGDLTDEALIMPTKTSELENDSGFITSSSIATTSDIDSLFETTIPENIVQEGTDINVTFTDATITQNGTNLDIGE